MVLNKNLLAVALTSSFLVVAGCSSSDDDDNNTLKRTGQAIDGYLTNAAVCLDANLNSKCDDSEPDAKTGEKGKFTVSHPSQFANAPTLARAIKDETVDSDAPDTPVAEGFDLVAPPSAKVVTPLTTLVQADAEEQLASNDSLSRDNAVASAKQNLQNALGTGSEGVDVLNDDYVAAQQDDDSAKATAAKKVAATARSVNNILRDTRKKVDEKVDENTEANLGDKADAAISRVAINKVRNKLSGISTQVNNEVDAGGDDVNLDTVVSNVTQNPANSVDDSELTNVTNEVTQAKSQLENVEDRFDEDDGTGAVGGSES
ncbi:hypothetical protein ACMDCT_14045 [Halomonadaceae bacterium KBTZ08]